jgi:hypothetical protein
MSGQFLIIENDKEQVNWLTKSWKKNFKISMLLVALDRSKHCKKRRKGNNVQRKRNRKESN